VFFRLNTWELWLIIAAIVLGFVAVGYVAGIALRSRSEALREPIGVVQGALLALVGLILAFGLTLAIGRYDGRRVALIDDANAIGTAYLRAQTLAEPQRSKSLRLLVQYTEASIRLSHAVPTTVGAFPEPCSSWSCSARPCRSHCWPCTRRCSAGARRPLCSRASS